MNERDPIVLPHLTDEFIESVRREIREYGLIPEGSNVVVACSGGADSVALTVCLRVLAEPLGFSMRIGHVNHCSRGEDSDGDTQWVVALGHALHVPVHVASADVPRIRERRGGSFEEVARDARYRLLRDICRTTGSTIIATAHHVDDQAETVLMHLLRGSGLTGLGGMSRMNNGIVRPLISTTRADIEDALRRWNIPWRVDASNESVEYERNRIRHELIPALERDWNPKIVSALGRLAEAAATDDDALNEFTEEALNYALLHANDQAVVLDCASLRTYHSAIRRRVIRHASRMLRTVAEPLNYAETMRVETLIDAHRRVNLRGKLNAVSKRGVLWIEAADAWQGPVQVHVPGCTPVPGWGTLFVEPAGNERERLTSGALTIRRTAEEVANGLTIRRWRPGDRIARRSMRKTDPIAGIANRASNWRLDTPGLLIVSNSERILWAIGLAQARKSSSKRHPSDYRLRWEWE